MTPSYHPAAEPSAWTRAEMAADTSWQRLLRAAELAALDRAMRAAEAGTRPWHAITETDFADPALDPLVTEIRAALRDGRGMILLRGLPVERYTEDQIRLIHWGLGTRIGTAVTQNAAADLVAGVYDRGLSYTDRNVRAYQVNAELKLHNDNSDIVALLCVRQAPEGGETLLVSATAAYNRMLERHRDLLPLLFNGYVYCRKGEQGSGEPAFSQKIPVFTETDGIVSCRYARSYIDHAEKTTGIALAPLERAALDALDAICREPDLMLEFKMQPGDIQYANNYTVLHARRGYTDAPEAKRLMLRLWLEADWVRPVADPMARYEFIRFGNAGRTAAQLHGPAAEPHQGQAA